MCYIGWRHIPTFVAAHHFQPATPISVIIVARNEEKYIDSCLQSIFEQEYPNHLYEVLVVDDQSTDQSAQLVTSWQEKHRNLRLLTLIHESAFVGYSSKKAAIWTGVNKASGELVVLTDADCTVPRSWLSTIAAYYQQFKPNMLLMPLRMDGNGNILYHFQRMDFSGLIGITAGSLYWNMPVMANGGNIAFRKEAFIKVKGYEGNEQIPGGDDIYLLQKIKKIFPGTVHFLKSASATVTTQPATTWRDFYHQRIRWISKARHPGDWKITAILVWAYLFNLLLLLHLLWSCIIGSATLLWLTVAVYGAKWTAEALLIRTVSVMLKHPFSLSCFLWNNMLHQLYVIIFGLLALRGRYEWKGRNYS